MSACVIERVDAGFKISGLINFDTVTDLYKQGAELLEKLDRIYLDFSEVTHADSSAIALLLNWIRVARRKGKFFMFVNLPAQLLEMANVCEVMPFLQKHMLSNK
jgi:phospholipid transport system transporter-binding protein